MTNRINMLHEEIISIMRYYEVINSWSYDLEYTIILKRDFENGRFVMELGANCFGQQKCIQFPIEGIPREPDPELSKEELEGFKQHQISEAIKKFVEDRKSNMKLNKGE